jgi:hypothetical protein
MAMSWDTLRELRMHGQKPALPVIVTNKPHLPRKLEGVGCLTILHAAGEAMPIGLIEGLDVIFFFDRCDLADHVYRLAQAKRVKLGRTRTWCSCASLLSDLPMSCASHVAAIMRLEGRRES